MTTGLTYSTFLAQISTMAVVDPTDTNFLTVLPMAITYAENRICRDLDLLQFSASISGFSLTVGSRQLNVPAGTVVVSEQINIITPAGTSSPDAGTRNPCTPVTKEFLDLVYGNPTLTGLPQYFAPFNDNQFFVGPFPDQNYSVELVGVVRPASLSPTNTTTFIASYLPDLFIMAAMVYISGYQRNFSATSDDPQMAVNYENQYSKLLSGATVEEARKKFEAAGWTSQTPAPVASPTRG
jgi:hypothetical protein